MQCIDLSATSYSSKESKVTVRQSRFRLLEWLVPEVKGRVPKLPSPEAHCVASYNHTFFHATFRLFHPIVLLEKSQPYSIKKMSFSFSFPSRKLRCKTTPFYLSISTKRNRSYTVFGL
jgi:hypothetical protein